MPVRNVGQAKRMRTKLTVIELKRASRVVALLFGIALGVACGSAEADHAPYAGGASSARAAGQSGHAAQAGMAGSSAHRYGSGAINAGVPVIAVCASSKNDSS
jgi:hypothetical protein